MTSTHQSMLEERRDSGYSSRPISTESKFFKRLRPTKGGAAHIGSDLSATFWVNQQWPESTVDVQGRCVGGTLALTTSFEIDGIEIGLSVRPILKRQGNMDGITAISVTKSAFQGANIHVDLPTTQEKISRPKNVIAQLVVYDNTEENDSDEESGFGDGGNIQQRQSVIPGPSRNGLGEPNRINGFIQNGGRSSRPSSSSSTNDRDENRGGGSQRLQLAGGTMSGPVQSNGVTQNGGRSRGSCSTPQPARPAQQKFQIFVKYFGGSPTSFNVSNTTRVEQLKDMIYNSKIALPQCQQRLLFEGLDMQDGKTLVSYGVKENSFVNCVGRLRGG